LDGSMVSAGIIPMNRRGFWEKVRNKLSIINRIFQLCLPNKKDKCKYNRLKKIDYQLNYIYH
jgi:hypothetical protein